MYYYMANFTFSDFFTYETNFAIPVMQIMKMRIFLPVNIFPGIFIIYEINLVVSI